MAKKSKDAVKVVRFAGSLGVNYFLQINTKTTKKLTLRKYNRKTRKHEIFTQTK